MESGLSLFGLPRNDVRVKSIFARHFKPIWVVQPACEKYCACAVGQIRSTCFAVSPERGADRDRHERCGGTRWTLQRHETNDVATDGEVVWSWPPDAEVKLAKT